MLIWLDGERLGLNCSNMSFYGFLVWSSGSFKFVMKIRQVFYLYMMKLMWIVWCLCCEILCLWYVVWYFYLFINSVVIKVECMVWLFEVFQSLLVLKQVVCKLLEVVFWYFEIYFCFFKFDFVKSVFSVFSSLMFVKVVFVINNGFFIILGKCSYEQYNGVDGNMKKCFLMFSRGLVNYGQIRYMGLSWNFLFNGKFYFIKVCLIWGGFLFLVKWWWMNWIDVLDDVFYMVIEEIRKICKLFLFLEIKCVVCWFYKFIVLCQSQVLLLWLLLFVFVNDEFIVIEDQGLFLFVVVFCFLFVYMVFFQLVCCLFFSLVVFYFLFLFVEKCVFWWILGEERKKCG